MLKKNFYMKSSQAQGPLSWLIYFQGPPGKVNKQRYKGKGKVDIGRRIRLREKAGVGGGKKAKKRRSSVHRVVRDIIPNKI